jgi:hypothetical protein
VAVVSALAVVSAASGIPGAVSMAGADSGWRSVTGKMPATIWPRLLMSVPRVRGCATDLDGAERAVGPTGEQEPVVVDVADRGADRSGYLDDLHAAAVPAEAVEVAVGIEVLTDHNTGVVDPEGLGVDSAGHLDGDGTRPSSWPLGGENRPGGPARSAMSLAAA